jgi:hypothetical protein
VTSECGHQLPPPLGQQQAPDYVVVVRVNDWGKEHFPVAEVNLWAPWTAVKTPPGPELDLEADHDPDPEVTAMTLTINDTR